MKTALKGNLEAFDQLTKAAQKRQSVTLFGDEETIKAQALAQGILQNAEAVKKLTPLAQDLASAKGMKLETAFELIAKSVGSSTNAMSRYGIQIEGAVGSNERLESAINAVGKAFGGQAEAAAKTGLGLMQQLSNTLGDIQEKIGGALLPGLNKLAGGLNSLISPQQTNVDLVKEQQRQFNDLTTKLQLNWEKLDDRKKILSELQSKYPGFLKNLDAEKLSYTDLTEAIKVSNSEYLKRIVLASQEDKIKSLQEQRDKATKNHIENQLQLTKQLSYVQEKTGLYKNQGEDELDYLRRVRKTTEGAAIGQDFYNRALLNAGVRVKKYNSEISEIDGVVKNLTKSYDELYERLNLFSSSITTSSGGGLDKTIGSAVGETTAAMATQATAVGAKIGAAMNAGMTNIKAIAPSSSLGGAAAPSQLQAGGAEADPLGLNGQAEKFNAIATAAGAMGSAISSSFGEGEQAGNKFGDMLKNMAKQAIKGFIAQGIAAAISRSIATLPMPWGLPAAAAAGVATNTLLNRAIQYSHFLSAQGSRPKGQVFQKARKTASRCLTSREFELIIDY